MAPSSTKTRCPRSCDPTTSGSCSATTASSRPSGTTRSSLRPPMTKRSVWLWATPSWRWAARSTTTTAVERWEPAVIGPVCDQLIDEIKNDGEADLVKALTFEFPTRIISVLLGLPAEDLDMFRRLSLDLISIPTDIEAGLTAAAELHGYFLDQVEQRRRKLTNAIIGDLVAAEIDGEKLTDEAIIAFLRLLLPAGLETTYRSSGNL